MYWHLMAKIQLTGYEFYSRTNPVKYTILQYLTHKHQWLGCLEIMQVIIRNNRKKLRKETLMLSIMKKCPHGEMQLSSKGVKETPVLDTSANRQHIRKSTGQRNPALRMN